MSLRLRSVCFAGLFVGCAALLGVGCSDDASKKVHGTGEAGEAGEAAGGAAAGTGGSGGSSGSTTTPEGGAAGETVVGEAGQGGAPIGAAGAAGAPNAEAGAGGEAGSGVLACTSTGTVNTLSIPETARLTVCRGAQQVRSFQASTTSPDFSCCSAYGPIVGIGGDGGGQLVFTVPDLADFGNQSLSVSCSEGLASGTIDLNVSDSAVAPEVDNLEESSIFQGADVQIDGAHLTAVTRVTAFSELDGSISDCNVQVDSSTDNTLVCSFDGNLAPGDYDIIVEEQDCGFAVNAPTLTIKQNL